MNTLRALERYGDGLGQEGKLETDAPRKPHGDKPAPLRLVKGQVPGEYERLAARLDFAPSALTEARIVEFMCDANIPRYDTDAVQAYMDRLAIAAGTNWCWKRLSAGQACPQGSDGYRLSWRIQYFGWTDPKGELYQRPVPVEMLRRADLLATRFPRLGFFVADYTDTQPDPFIMCWTRGMGDRDRIVFGVWDEPGFGG